MTAFSDDSLEAIYAAVPSLRCQGKCQDACGPVAMSKAEEAVFDTAGKEVPDFGSMLTTGHLECPHLSPVGRCTVYEIRPLICRLYGAAELLTCRWGCVPERLLTHAEGRSLIRRADALPPPK